MDLSRTLVFDTTSQYTGTVIRGLEIQSVQRVCEAVVPEALFVAECVNRILACGAKSGIQSANAAAYQPH